MNVHGAVLGAIGVYGAHAEKKFSSSDVKINSTESFSNGFKLEGGGKNSQEVISCGLYDKSAHSPERILKEEVRGVSKWLEPFYCDITAECRLGDMDASRSMGSKLQAKHAAYTAASAMDQLEYGNLVTLHIKNAHQILGLQSADGAFERVKLNSELDQELGKVFLRSVSQDSRLMKLMQRLGMGLFAGT